MTGTGVRRSLFLGLALLTLGAATTTSAAAAAAAAPPATPRASSAWSGVYGGGPFYQGGQAVMDDLRNSGFTTVMLWSIHVHSNGDLFYNDTLIVSGGKYVGDSGWPARLRTLKQAPTSVNRIEVSVGSWGAGDWASIRDLSNSQGTGSGSILYRNFQALQQATGADAVNDDDESTYDTNSTVAFAKMALGIGYHAFTIAPYTNSGFWRGVKNGLGASLDRAYLQEYAGGAGNDPASWNSALGMTVAPGLWSRNGSGCGSGDNPASVKSKMAAWRSSAGIQGGWMWLYDDIQSCSSQGTARDYATAINTALGATSTPGHTGPITGLAGKCVDVQYSNTADGTPVQLYTCNGSGAQTWTVNSNGSVSALGKCLDVSGSGTANGTVVQLWTCNSTGAQVWAVQGSALVNPQSTRCLDVTGGNSADGTRLEIWDCTGGANQQWRLP
jgi:Ricin-type beta-trefoil lectin domain